jgi:hypothetical protein
MMPKEDRLEELPKKENWKKWTREQRQEVFDKLSELKPEDFEDREDEK